jgi:cytochrome P450
MPAFSPKSMEFWGPKINENCERLIDRFLSKGTCDVSREFAFRVPCLVICTMIGISAEDEEKFIHWISAISHECVADPQGALDAAAEMMAYLDGVVAAHVAEPQGDLVDTLIAAEYEGRGLAHDEVAGVLWLMIIAGINSTWSVLTEMIMYLAKNPEDRRRLNEDRSMIQVAVEEFLRYYVTTLLARTATKDTVLDGHKIKAGDRVMVAYPSGNRDEKVFPDADRVVIDREQNRHLAFGAGIHRCIGAPLARRELAAALEVWLDHIPDWELADPEAIVYNSGPLLTASNVIVRFPVPTS